MKISEVKKSHKHPQNLSFLFPKPSLDPIIGEKGKEPQSKKDKLLFDKAANAKLGHRSPVLRQKARGSLINAQNEMFYHSHQGIKETSNPRVQGKPKKVK